MNRYNYIDSYKKAPYEPKFKVGSKLRFLHKTNENRTYTHAPDNEIYVVAYIDFDKNNAPLYFVVADSNPRNKLGLCQESYLQAHMTLVF